MLGVGAGGSARKVMGMEPFGLMWMVDVKDLGGQEWALNYSILLLRDVSHNSSIVYSA